MWVQRMNKWLIIRKAHICMSHMKSPHVPMDYKYCSILRDFQYIRPSQYTSALPLTSSIFWIECSFWATFTNITLFINIVDLGCLDQCKYQLLRFSVYSTVFFVVLSTNLWVLENTHGFSKYLEFPLVNPQEKIVVLKDID